MFCNLWIVFFGLSFNSILATTENQVDAINKLKNNNTQTLKKLEKINEDLSSWRVERVNRVSKGFYKSEAVELVR